MKATPTPAALTVPEEDLNGMREAFAFNVANGTISDTDLPRITVSPGTARWQVPTLEGEDVVPSVEGVVVHLRDTRVFYPNKDAGNVPPTCSSRDSKLGIGDPGGDCAACPLAQFGSAKDGSGGQACKQMKQLFILRGSSMFPEILSLPPTSAKPARQFFLKLTTQGIPLYRALISVGLEKAQSQAGQPYGKAVFKFVRKLSDEEAARTAVFTELCKGLTGPVAPPTPAEREAF
jgi:hypothetical protein